MNLHCSQSYEASTELAEIAAVPHQIVTPRHAKPLIGVVQDTLVGSYRITRPQVEFTRREFMNMMMWNKRFDGKVPLPVKGGQEAGGPKRWSGHQVISQLLPPINLEMGNAMYKDKKNPENFVKIKEGVISQGTLDKDIFSKPSKGIVHVTFRDYGSKDTVALIDSMQNTVEQFLVYNGFSVGISDLIADDKTRQDMADVVKNRKKAIEDILLQIHLDLFDNNTGKSNQQEFEDKVFAELNKATDESGKIGLSALSDENRLVAMVRAGSKGSTINISQMMACVGQQAPEGRRIPYGFTDRTLPHFKKYDDGAEARGFVENSFIQGLTPQEFFFHAMSGREGLIDTAVKSVTRDTTIIILEDGATKYVEIGDWIDAHMDAAKAGTIEKYAEANMELLNLENEVYIPTCDGHGNTSWGKLTAVTRHDPGECLYEIKTAAGRSVTVAKSKSLLIWDEKAGEFLPKDSPDVVKGDFIPVSANLQNIPVVTTRVDVANYLSKKEYLYGTDFHRAKVEIEKAMQGREHIPAGWWAENNGKTFTVPYTNKGRFQRAISGRTDMSGIEEGYVYAFSHCRDHPLPDRFELNERNGIFFGLYLAEGNADIPSGYVQISNNDPKVRKFVMDWFDEMGIFHKERFRTVTINTVDGGTSTGQSDSVRGYSRPLGEFLKRFLGSGSANKFVPNEAFGAPKEFICGLLNGYFSGDGSVDKKGYSITSSSVSKRLTEGIAFLCSCIGVFGQLSSIKPKSNNVGTAPGKLLPSYGLDIRSHWATAFVKQVKFIHDGKQEKANNLKCSTIHCNYEQYNDMVKDEILEINCISTEGHPKLYDVTVPSTINFITANGAGLQDTADTGYIQRQLVKAMEDLTVQYDGSVRDSRMNIVQFKYGEDGINSTKIESANLGLAKLSDADIMKEYGGEGVDFSKYLEEGAMRGEDAGALQAFAQKVLDDRYMLVEGINRSRQDTALFAPVNLERLILNVSTSFKLNKTEYGKTDLVPNYVIQGIDRLIERTQSYHKLWAALLRFYLAPHKIIGRERFTRKAFDALCELIIAKNWQGWAQPGEQVGIIAAQSIGEPSTQMSSVKTSHIHVMGPGGTQYSGQIGPYLDSIIEKNLSKLKYISNDSVVLDLEEDYYIVSVSQDEKTAWKRISQISRHPANGGLVKVTTKSGRSTTATLTHSFLRRSPKGIVPILGSELREGMRIPIARKVPEAEPSRTSVEIGDATVRLDREFGWLCGMYLADGSFNGNKVMISKVNPVVEDKMTAIGNKYGWEFTSRIHQGEYGESKDNNLYSKELKIFLNDHFSTGSYEKTIGPQVYGYPRDFLRGLIAGYFDGDGNVNVERQQIRVGSRSEDLIRHINRIFSYCGFFTVLGSETSVRMPGKIMHTLNILKKDAKRYRDEMGGFALPEKAAALEGIIAYIEREDKHDTKELYDKIPELGNIIAETGRLLKMPGQSRMYGRWQKKESIGRLTLATYIEDFQQQLDTFKGTYGQLTALQISENIAVLRSALEADVVWDEIVDLEYLDDPKEYVYDFTVPGNESFMVDDCVMVHNTLNSVDWDTKIVIAKDGKIWTPEIGDFIDEYYENCEDDSKIQRFPNGQIYIPLEDGHDWRAVSCDENGKMMWTKLEAITRHPVVNEDGTDTILEVELESGRTVKATKGKSFLTLKDGKITATNGSELNVGDELPIANSLALDQLGLIKEINLRETLSPKEYLYGTDALAALDAMRNSGDRHWFQKNQGNLFTVPYSRSDIFRDAFEHGRNSNAENIRAGYVYPKRTREDVSQIPESIPLTREFGFFVGAYLAEGMANTTQVNITNNDQEYLEQVKALMDAWNVRTHLVCEQREAKVTGIKGTSTSLVIHSTILAKVMQTLFGRVSYEKHLPDWVLQAPDAFLHGLIDAYISGDGCVSKQSGYVLFTSVSKNLIEGIQAVLARYKIFSSMTIRIPEQKQFKSVSTHYNACIPVKYSNIFHDIFKLSIGYKQDIIDAHFIPRKGGTFQNKRDELNEVVWDKIKTIKEVRPMKDGWVYDLTVESSRNFMMSSLVILADTFHLAGVAAKSNVTRGVPRLKELLKVTQNPKAISLTVSLKPEYRDSKEKARKVAQDLELTLLKDITIKAAIYYDPDETTTVIEEDRDLINFYNAFSKQVIQEYKEVDEFNKELILDQMAEDAPKVGNHEHVFLQRRWSKLFLRLEFDRERMFQKNITMDDIAYVLEDKLRNAVNLIYSDYNSQKLIMRIYLAEENKSVDFEDINHKNPNMSGLDDFSALKKLQNRILTGIVIRGVPGISAVTFRQDKDMVEYSQEEGTYKQVTQYVLDTDGTNFLAVMNHPYVDGSKLMSSHVHDIYENLGIEATRATLIQEITTLFEEAGVNYRHLGLLCDVMTRAGKLMSVDRYGINKMDIGPIAKASFEETEKILLRAALFGEMDPVTGISANIMMGQPIRGGTGFFNILLDEEAYMKMQRGGEAEEGTDEAEEEPAGLTEEQLEASEQMAEDDICSSARLRMNVMMPKSAVLMEEPDIDIEILDEEEEEE